MQTLSEMIRPVFFRTESGNTYLYSPSRSRISLIHPLHSHLFDLEQQGTDLRGIYRKVRQLGTYTLPGIRDFTLTEFTYLYRKYNFLKKNGFFKPRKRINLEGKLSATDINDNIPRIKQLIFEITEECNLACTYCTYSKFYVNKERASREPNLAEIRNTVQYFLSRRKDPNALLIVSFYGGEPLKNMKLIREVVSTLRGLPGNTVPFKFTMTSNGVFLKKYIDYLVENEFEVGISLDGDQNANTYRKLKNNKPSYSIVVSNLEFVKEKYPEYFEKNINFMSVMHNRNNFGTLEKFFREKFGKTPLMSDINTVGISAEFREEFQNTFVANKKDDRNDREPMQKLMLKHPRVKDVADMVERYSGLVYKNHYQVLQPGTDNKLKKKYIPTSTCTPFALRAFITTEGKVLPCEHISREFEIGSVSANKVNINNREVAGMFNRYYQKIKTFCDKCYLADNCKECMFNTGVETDQPSCEFFMGYTRFSQYLARHFSIIENDYPFFLNIAEHAFRKEGT